MGTREFNPFLFYSKQLQGLLAKAAKQENPALWLFKHDARTCLFMLEALTRLHKKAYDKKVFVKWNSRFKKLEDLFGEIDKYAVLEKDFKTNKKISPEALKYFSVHTNRHITRCNQRLREKEWLEGKLQEFDEGIKEFKITYDEDHISGLKFAMRNEIDEILYFARKYDYAFTRLEEQVHEIRRKIRWLSIYAVCLKGLVQLKASTKKHKYHIHYFTKEVLNSPFNQPRPRPKHVAVAHFDQDSFLALSWLINELGLLKDRIIKLHELKDAIYVAENVTEEKALAKAISILGLKKSTEKDVLREASEKIKAAFVKDQILDTLLIA
jgi:hypothetical protein